MMEKTGKNDESTAAAAGAAEEEQCWRIKLRVMKERFARRLDENAYGGVRDRQIDHGLKLSQSGILHKSFADMCFCEKTQVSRMRAVAGVSIIDHLESLQEYLVLDKGLEVQRYSMQGKQLRPSFPLGASMSFSRMLWCDGETGPCLVGYDPEDEFIWLLNSSCESLQPALKNEFRTRVMYYEPGSNRIVVVGTDQSVQYSLEDPEKELESSKPMTYHDSEFGPTWQLECSALVRPHASSPDCRLAASYLTTLYLLALEVDKEADDPEDSCFIARRINASPAAVTALQLYEPTGWIVSGDQQGNVMAYNQKLECVMAHEGAHESRVTMLVPHPSICGFLSNASDKLQVWCCNFRDKVEWFDDLGGTILALAVNSSAATVVALAAHKISFLTMHQLYSFFAPLTSGAKYMNSTCNPMYPTKTIVVSQDNSVRIFSSGGKQLNVQILPEKGLNTVSAVYCGNANRLFTIILNTGEILVSDSGACPMKFKSVFVSNQERITSIAGYEFYDEIRNDDGTSKNERLFYPMDFRIIAGTDDGKLIVINSVTGKHESMRSVHCGSVIQLRSSTITHRLVSLGTDKCVKVWRILPDLSQPLHLFYDIHFTVPITLVATMGLILCAVSSSRNSSIHQTIMYNMKERERLEHRSADDHSAPIVNMITSESLTICATSSLDNTIRIWSHENCLVNLLQMNICAWNMAFSSIKGDIIFGAGRHLYKVPYENYLTPYYRAKISNNDLSEDENEQPVPENSEYKIYESQVDRNAMLHPVNTLPLGSIDVSNSESPQVDLLIQKQICELIESRDEDIRKIKNYLASPSKVVAKRALMTTQQWEEYTNDLLNSLTRTPSDVPEFRFASIVETNSQEKKTYNKPGVFRMLFGYGLENLEDAENLTEIVMNSKLPLNGFLPNSILYKHKEPEIPKVYEPPPKRELPKYKYPPEFLKESRESILEARESIRLSQLVLVETDKTDET